MSLAHDRQSTHRREPLLDDGNKPFEHQANATREPAHATPVDWAVFQDQVKTSLAEYFAAQKFAAKAYSPAFVELWDHIAASTSGGKWMRPKLVYLTYHAFGGQDWRACSELAAAYEMLHAALLVHDDVIDRDFVRRGSATLGATYRDAATAQGHAREVADHAGYSAAIIAGDLLLTGSLRLATSATAGHAQAGAILATVHEAIFASAAGELDDLLFSLGRVSPGLGDVLNMERLKTAVYSFEMPLRAGALLAGVGQESADALAAVGRDIGVAYQVVDDVLGTFGQESVTGKSVESDLREGKRTILTTFAQGSGEFAEALTAFRDGRAEVDDVRAVLQELGAKEYALNLAQSLVSDALGKAQQLDVPEFLYLELAQICDYVLARRN
ncbi:polyprenyl synthetase family protein [Arthrobacter sp.]|uniref:polyprenyl synthetase family protein n=1 Tax=Arthrobacter sp. TaxID=1667 RepID=UPI0026DFDA3A|nr:polyprenyl synthetase family protein [Arthrobacter sp.]MDO5754225.1 polyprenyl synthetase family protein [Arthrobacter sp.]